MPHLRYNNLEVITMSVQTEQVKALIDQLSEEQLQALWVILKSMAWPEVEISPEDEKDIKEGLEELDSGSRVSAEDAWKELGI